MNSKRFHCFAMSKEANLGTNCFGDQLLFWETTPGPPMSMGAVSKKKDSNGEGGLLCVLQGTRPKQIHMF